MNREVLISYFLGYDYAYSGGSYYSCIANDVISGRIPEMKRYILNKFGLFNTIKEVNEFIVFRNKLMDKYEPLTFEEGDFIIYKIDEVMEIRKR